MAGQEIEEMVAELWVRWIGGWCGVDGMRARRRRVASTVGGVACLVSASERERKRVRVSMSVDALRLLQYSLSMQVN